MKTAVVAALGAIALVSAAPAFAADLPARNQAPYVEPLAQSLPVFTWSGFYAGVNGGFDIANFNGGAGKYWGGALGGMFGGTAGYNYQYNQVVFGVEGDFDIDTVRNHKTLPGPAFGFGKLTDELTLRARAGVAVERSLLYVTGGYVGGDISGSLQDTTLAPGTQYFATEGWRSGYALGAGIEYAFTDRISGKGEYLYENLGTQRVFTSPRLTNAGATDHVLRGGVNYHF
jgi:outer membrane immunogenic protein